MIIGGYVSKELEFNVYSGVVYLDTIRIEFTATDLMKPKTIAVDVGSAYIQVFMREKTFAITVPEFVKLPG